MRPQSELANDEDVYDALVIGGGQAGLAAGYHLGRRRARFAILESRDASSGSWPSYYSSLQLFSPAKYSSLPGFAFPGPPQRRPLRDEVAAYLKSYGERFGLPVVTHTRVERVERDGSLFRVVDQHGRVRRSRALIAASGSFGNPFVPDIAGASEFTGRILHASAYHDPEPFRGQRLVVVGGANTAVQIGCELAQVARTTLAARRRIRFRPLRILGRSTYAWLRLTGLDRSRLLDGRNTDVIDDGTLRAALAAGAPDRRRMFTRFTADGVEWRDGTREHVDAVIFATGYRPNLSFLAGLPALDSEKRALHRCGVSLTIAGLYFVGLVNQTCYASATLRGVGADAKLVVDHLARFCGI